MDQPEQSLKKHQYSISLTDRQAQALIEEGRLRGYGPWEVLRRIIDDWIDRRAPRPPAPANPERPMIARVVR